MLLLIPPVCLCQIKVHEICPGNRLDYTPSINRSFEHHAGDSTIRLVSTLILTKNILEVVRDPHVLTPSANLTRELAARRPFRVSPCGECTKHSQTSIPSLGFELRTYSTAVRVTNHYTG
ncbi:hypothetical protein TNCV_2495351 [Trichonephila clavipes]|nr:hypothetical protein TNCV_2495351 [Trichonephila clavipes]